MQPEDLQKRWEEQGEEMFAAVAQWRAAHPHATLAEIEHAVDEQMHRLRARMIEQAAQASAAAESEANQGLVCEQCGQPLQARGRAKRRWQTHGGQQVEVERTYVTCLQCGGGFFPPGSRIGGPRWTSVAACAADPGEHEQRTAVWAGRAASGEDVGSGGACLDSTSADAFGRAACARGAEQAGAAAVRLPRGASLRAHGDEQRRE